MLFTLIKVHFFAIILRAMLFLSFLPTFYTLVIPLANWRYDQNSSESIIVSNSFSVYVPMCLWHQSFVKLHSSIIIILISRVNSNFPAFSLSWMPRSREQHEMQDTKWLQKFSLLALGMMKSQRSLYGICRQATWWKVTKPVSNNFVTV